MKKLIAGLFIILFHCNFAVSNISGAQQLFCSGIFEDRRVFENSGTCYSPEWLETVISEQIPRDQLPNHITVRNYNASLIIRTDPAADSLQYTIKGLHKDAVTIRKNANSLSIIEQEIRPRNRQTGNPWDRIIADIELIIPLSATLQTVSIESVIESAEITALSCETLTVKQSVGQITAADIHCSTLNITGNVAPLTLKNILCSTCDIRTSTANTTIENFTATDRAFFHTSTGAMRIINGQLNNPSLSLTGSFDFTGSIQGDVRLNGGIGRIDMDLQNSEKNRTVRYRLFNRKP